MIKQLRKRFILIATLATALVLFLIIGSINIINFNSINHRINAKLSILSENNGEFPDTDMDKQHQKGPQKPNSEFSPGKPMDNLPAEAAFDTRFFTVTLDQDGQVLSTETEHIFAISNDSAADYATSLYKKGKNTGFVARYKYASIKITDNTQSNSSFTMYIFVDCERELSSFRQFLLASISISLIGLLSIFLLLLPLSRRAIAPIVESYEKQKRFITDASHELKTPLTIIDANTEVIEMETGENEWTKSTKHQVKRLTDLTNKLVLLSRMDEGSNTPVLTDCNLSELVENATLPYEALASTSGKNFSQHICPDLHCLGDPAMLTQVLTLILDNAMKYSTENGQIYLTLTERGRNKILTLTNSCDSITKGRHDELFQRFYRTDESRNSKTGGHGIGLSVVQAIVNSHKGKVSAYSDDGTSLTIVITL